MKNLSIYIHIPFCVKKCHYCDFPSFATREEERNDYLECLLQEIQQEANSYLEYEVQTVFIGGGTPSLIAPKWIECIMLCLRENYKINTQAEISMEVNPGTIDKIGLETYFNAGINRLSIGLQSTKDEELKMLGRIHTFEEFLSAYHWAGEVGFQNINVDIMSAIPGQDLESYQETLQTILSLKPAPTHISAYSLMIEEGTPFFEWDTLGKLELPDEDVEREMYVLTETMLLERGYHRYEISNYAKEGYECRHNKVYWTRENYVGFGLAAASMVENVRMTNESTLKEYKSKVKTKNKALECHKLSISEQMEEFMFLGLRLTEGIRRDDFKMNFGINIEDVYGAVLNKHEKQGLIIMDEKIRLTKRGMDVSNYILSDFLL